MIGVRRLDPLRIVVPYSGDLTSHPDFCPQVSSEALPALRAPDGIKDEDEGFWESSLRHVESRKSLYIDLRRHADFVAVARSAEERVNFAESGFQILKHCCHG
jgi:hypothetical protein